MSDLRKRRDVQYLQAGIADRLAEDQFGVGLDGGAEAVVIAWLDEGGCDAKTRQRLRQQADRTAVK